MLPGFDLTLPGRILFGRGQARQAGPVIAGLGRHVFVVHGRHPRRSEWLVDALRGHGLAVTGHACPGEPTLTVLANAVAALRAAGADCVAGVGGGAAMDLAKAAAALARADGPPLAYLDGLGDGRALDAAPLPLVLIPTTAGTGSEVTRNAVIGVPAAGRKVSLRDPRLVARVAIVDPALTDGAPRGVTLAAGMDALVQVIEPYLSTRANPLTDALCRAAIPQGLRALADLMDRDTPEARDRMAWVALAGGIALAHAGLGAVHGLAGVIGGRTEAPHGAVCGTLLAAVMAANRAAADGDSATRLAEVEAMIAAVHGPRGSVALAAWARDHGLPGLAALGLRQRDHAAVAAEALRASAMASNPVRLSPEALVAVLAAS